MDNSKHVDTDSNQLSKFNTAVTNKTQPSFTRQISLQYRYEDALEALRQVQSNGWFDKHQFLRILETMPSRQHTIIELGQVNYRDRETEQQVRDRSLSPPRPKSHTEQRTEHRYPQSHDVLRDESGLFRADDNLQIQHPCRDHEESTPRTPDQLQDQVISNNNQSQVRGRSSDQLASFADTHEGKARGNVEVNRRVDVLASGSGPSHNHLSNNNAGEKKAVFAQLKNQGAVCVSCWLKDLPCDQGIPCSFCISADTANQCFYVRCPVRGCSVVSKCPALHVYSDHALDGHLASPMHLIALVNFKISKRGTGGFKHFINLHNTRNTAQWFFGLIRAKLRSHASSGAKLDFAIIRSYVIEAVGGARDIRETELNGRINLIVKLIEEMEYPPFKELWARDENRINKFASKN